MSVHSCVSLFVCIRRVRKLSAHPERTWWQPCQRSVRPYLLCPAHAVRTCLWCHLWMKFRKPFSSVWGAQQLVVFWLADLAHFAASVCPFPAIWGDSLTLWCPPHGWENTAHPNPVAPPHTDEWDDCPLLSIIIRHNNTLLPSGRSDRSLYAKMTDHMFRSLGCHSDEQLITPVSGNILVEKPSNTNIHWTGK